MSREQRPDGSLPGFPMRQILNLYPHDYSMAFAFSILLYLHPHQVILRFPCPWGVNTGLPSSEQHTNERVRFCLSAGGVIVHVFPLRTGITIPLTFWCKPDSIFGLFHVTTFKRQFTMLIVPFSLAPSPHDASSDQYLSRFTEAMFAKLHCSQGFRQGRCQLCLPR